jgi:hypothetical protein
MVPEKVVKAIGIAISQLREYASMSNELITLYTIARETGGPRGIYSRFVGRLAATGRKISTTTASTIYRAARFFAAPATALAYLPEGTPIDPRLARDLPSSGKYAAEIGSYRAMVEFQVTDPDTGKSTIKYVWVKSLYPLSQDEAFDEGRVELERVLSGTPLTPGKTNLSDYSITQSITDYARFV